MTIEDEYNRDYSFEPEFIKRKDSLEMHRSRLERTRKHNKMFKRKLQCENVVAQQESFEELVTALSAPENIVEAEVDAFRMVKNNGLNYLNCVRVSYDILFSKPLKLFFINHLQKKRKRKCYICDEKINKYSVREHLWDVCKY